MLTESSWKKPLLAASAFLSTTLDAMAKPLSASYFKPKPTSVLAPKLLFPFNFLANHPSKKSKTAARSSNWPGQKCI